MARPFKLLFYFNTIIFLRKYSQERVKFLLKPESDGEAHSRDWEYIK